MLFGIPYWALAVITLADIAAAVAVAKLAINATQDDR